ncbi:MAG: secondary thiamine-phosphate synthase enzyme YjbQ [Verrucomicrobiales bacterium]|nr:secondary thiamine-phosphate synthase enzyme YjbQ [Verrucomicrobiales bacterium]
MVDIFQKEFTVKTSGKGTYEITDEVERFIRSSRVDSGQITVFVRHTSASLVIMENADPSARTDLHAFFNDLVPEDLPYLVHTYEGADDSPSHLRMALTRTSEVIPVINGKSALGTWQGVFLFEHRRAPHQRRICLTLIGTVA